MSDNCCQTKILSNLLLQENGIIRNSHGEIIAHLDEDIKFDMGSVEVNVSRFNPVIDTCDYGHEFAKLPNHPIKDNHPRCPVCMSVGLEHSRKKYDWLLKWFVRGGQRHELVPNGHIQLYNEQDVDVAIENHVK